MYFTTHRRRELNLWAALKQNDAVAEAIDYVAAEYTRRAGMAPGESTR